MADLFCTFLDFRSLTTNTKLPLILPSNRYYSCVLHSHNSRISRVRRRPLHLSRPSSSEIDLISTHEHTDGSLVFRFGDPTEAKKNVETEELQTVKEEIEGETEDASGVLKVVESDNGTEVKAKKADNGVTSSSLDVVADHSNSIASSSRTVTVVEGESESCEKLLEGSSDIELPVLTSSEETERVSTPDVVDMEDVEYVREGLNEESDDSSPVESVVDEGSKVETDIGTVALSERETADVTFLVKETEVASAVGIEQTGNVEEGLNEEYVDSVVEASIFDKSSEMVNNISTVALSEKESGDITSGDVGIEQSGSAGVDVDEKHEELNTANVSNKRPEVDNETTTLDFSDKETGEVTSMTDENIGVSENGVLVAGLETEVTEDVSPISENQNVETEMQNEATEDERESFGSNLVSQIEEENLQAEMEKVDIGKSSESELNGIMAPNMKNGVGSGSASDISDAEAETPPVEAAVSLSVDSEDKDSGDMIQLVTVPPRLEADSVLEEETSRGIVEESGEDDGSENLIMDRELVEASIQEAMVPNETLGCASENDGIKLLTETPQLDDSMLDEETGIGAVEESHEDDGPENLKVVGDLVEASEPEATTLTESSTMSQEMLMTNFVLSSGAHLLPHPSKVLTGGEDAFFLAGQTWLGVADGVGLWSLEGTNPGIYAQELVKICERLISTDNGNSIKNPIELLSRSVAETYSPGSSTVLLAQFDGQALHVANIGDSGFIVVRHGVVYKRSSPMHHVFHFPIQIERGDDPSSLAEFYTVNLEEEDVIITATDGLLDNLYDQEISSIVMKSLAADKKLEEIAELVAMRAQEIGKSASMRSPFGDDAHAAGFAGYSGGKLDDVAVIVSVVQRR